VLDRRGQDTATVVIAVGVGDINLALRKPATESSTYTYSIPVAASYAVDGNTDGSFTCKCNTGYSGDGFACAGKLS
jgi:hypothetical protein